jgi:hypothetical protein
MKYEKYDVNGFRFHTEAHQKGRANSKTVNSGVFTGGADGLDYYGRLENVYELTFNRMNIQLNLVVFKCHWFNPRGGQRSTKSIGLLEVRPSTTYRGADVFVVAHQAKQVYYLPYPCQKVELRGWKSCSRYRHMVTYQFPSRTITTTLTLNIRGNFLSRARGLWSL